MPGRLGMHLDLQAIDLLLKATLVLFWTLVGLAFLRKGSAASRHVVGMLGLAAVLLLPALGAFLPRVSLPVFELREGTGPLRSEEVAESAADPGTPAAKPAPAAAAQAGVALTAPAPAPSHRLRIPRALPKLLLIVWAIGSTGFLLQLCLSILRVRRMQGSAAPVLQRDWLDQLRSAQSALALEDDVLLLRSREALVPMTAGLLEPVLLLPKSANGWPVARRRMVLLHELAHVQRRDWLALIVGEIALGLFWFHPLAWLLLQKVRRDREQAADDLVLVCGTRPSAYAVELLAIVRALKNAPVSGLASMAMASRSELPERLAAILDPARPRTSFTGRQVLWHGLAMLGAVTALASIQTFAVRDAAAAGSNYKTAEARSGRSYYSEGTDLLSEGDYAASRAALERAIALGYRTGPASYNVACGYALSGDREQAFTWLRKAAEAGFDLRSYLDDDKDLRSLRSDGRLRELRRLSRDKALEADRAGAQKAIAHYQQLGEDDPGSAWYAAGKELLSVGEWDLAKEAFLTSAARGKSEGASTYNAACALARKGDDAQALEMLGRALDAGFDDPGLLEKDDDLETLHQDPQFARLVGEAHQLALSISGWSVLNQLHVSHRDADAERRFQDYLRGHPQSGRAHFSLGMLALNDNRPEDARASFQHALDLGYRRPTTTYNLACANARAGDKERALSLLSQTFALFDPRDLGMELKGDSDLDSLHGDSRFEALVRRQQQAHSRRASRDSE